MQVTDKQRNDCRHISWVDKLIWPIELSNTSSWRTPLRNKIAISVKLLNT
jgi:hypothetical protein